MVEIIAEIGINHNGNINLAHELIRQAAISGADVAKFQAYSVDALFGPDGEDPNPEIHVAVKPLEFNKAQLAQCKDWCHEEGIEFMCSVFDEERLGWMEALGVKRHKIASRTSKYTPDLARKIADTGKPCYMSLGFNSTRIQKDLDGDGKYFEPYYNVKCLYCVAEYPTEYKNIKVPEKFVDRTNDGFYGFSDHTIGIEASLVAVARGAKIIEKHFTLDKSAEGFDHICSITPAELKDLAKYSKLMSKVV